MFQQILALLIIIIFIIRLIWQKSKNNISFSEYVFWLIFWALACLSVIFIKVIDQFVAFLGFSARGIDILIYLGVVILFYLFLRLRLKLVKLEREITKIVREIALKNSINKHNNIYESERDDR